MQSKPKRIAYWVTTGVFAAAFLASGVAELVAGPAVVASMRAIGYPLYFLGILGVWKVLGAAALVAPGLPRLKEWAYAGIFFDLTGAAVSHWCSGDPAGKIATPLVFLLLAGASWALRPASRAWASPTAARHSKAAGPSNDGRAAHASA